MEVHSLLAGMGVHYVVVEHSWCVGGHRPAGCTLHQVWGDTEGVMDLGHPVCCELLEQIMPDQKMVLRKELVPVWDMVPDHEVVPDLDMVLPFTKVFQNKEYHVLKVQ